MEDGSAGGQRGGKNGLSLSPPSLPPQSLLLTPSLPPFACVQLLQLSVSPLTLSGSNRQESKGPLLDANSVGTTAASRKTHWSEGTLRGRIPTGKD